MIPTTKIRSDKGNLFLTVIALAFLFWFLGCSRQPHLSQGKYEYLNYTINNEWPEDSLIWKTILPYRQKLEKEMNDTLCFNAQPLQKAQPEGSLGNLLADIMLQKARQVYPKVDFAVTNHGGIRIPSLQKGPVTVGKVFEIMPFDNQLTLLEIPGKVVIQFVDHLASTGGWPVAGLSFSIQEKKAKSLLINGLTVDTSANYYLATTDYLSGGGDFCDFLIGWEEKNSLLLMRNVLIEYFRQIGLEGKPLTIPPGGRIRNE